MSAVLLEDAPVQLTILPRLERGPPRKFPNIIRREWFTHRVGQPPHTEPQREHDEAQDDGAPTGHSTTSDATRYRL